MEPFDQPPARADATDPGDPNSAQPTEAPDAAVLRILDVNANRAAEGLRVIEDYLRFAREDAQLARHAKQLRHHLVDTLSLLSGTGMVLARDAGGDVGRTVKTPQELDRSSVGAVVRANFKRSQQALRNLEEWSKLIHRQAAQRFEVLRYELYELETALERSNEADRELRDTPLCVLIDGGTNEADFVGRATSLIEAGVPMLQLRDKQSDDRERIKRGQCLVQLARGTSTLVVINDRPDLALAVGAHGVHLGQEDMPVNLARRLMGPRRLIGVSTHSIEQARTAVMQGASYLGVGPVFESRTKSFDKYPGLDLVGAVAAEIRLPAFAIGGIDLTRLPELMACGMWRVAVSSAVWQAASPAETCREFVRQLTARRDEAPAQGDAPKETRT